MQHLIKIQENARRLTPQRVKSDLFKFIRTLEEELAAYNRTTLYEDSESVEGKPIGFYSKATELITNGRKKSGEPFDLLESGDFLDGLFAKVQGDSVLFDTKDSKRKEVLDNLLTEDIFGLQEEDLNKVIETRLLPWAYNYFIQNLLSA